MDRDIRSVFRGLETLSNEDLEAAEMKIKEIRLKRYREKRDEYFQKLQEEPLWCRSLSPVAHLYRLNTNDTFASRVCGGIRESFYTAWLLDELIRTEGMTEFTYCEACMGRFE